MDRQDDNEELTFDDGSGFQYGNQGEITHEQLVLQQIKRVMEEGSKEMVGGYFKEQMTKTGLKEVYIPDQKQVYIRSIMSLYDVMIHKFSDSTQFKTAKTNFDTKIKKIKEDAAKILQAKLDYLKKMEQNQGVKAPAGLKETLELQISTGMLDNDSYEAKMVSDKTLEAYRYLFQSLVRVYGEKGFGDSESLDDSKWLSEQTDTKDDEKVE